MTTEALRHTDPEVNGVPEGPWVPGALFYVIKDRFWMPTDGSGYEDRLKTALTKGLQPPAQANGANGRTKLSYDQVVALRRYDPEISRLESLGPYSAVVFVDSDFPVVTAGELGAAWELGSADEVYSLGPIPPERLTPLT